MELLFRRGRELNDEVGMLAGIAFILVGSFENNVDGRSRIKMIDS